MSSALKRFAALLELERQAAIAADVTVLETLQEEKRAVVDALSSAPPGDPMLAPLIEQARANVRLIAQLVELHRALVAHAADPTYTARGHVRSSSRPEDARVSRAG